MYKFYFCSLGIMMMVRFLMSIVKVLWVSCVWMFLFDELVRIISKKDLRFFKIKSFVSLYKFG